MVKDYVVIQNSRKNDERVKKVRDEGVWCKKFGNAMRNMNVFSKDKDCEEVKETAVNWR